MSTTNTLTFSITTKGSGTLLGARKGTNRQGSFQIGSGDWPALLMAYINGTSDVPTGTSGQANQWFIDKRTCNAGSNDNLDMYGGLTNELGQTVQFAKIKLILIIVLNPDGTKKLLVGPQGVAHAFQGPFSGGAGATIYKEVKNWDTIVNDIWAGYSIVDATNDVLGISNPGGTNIDYIVAILGVQ